MFDLLMLTLLTVAFIGAAGYIRVCVNLTRPDDTAKSKAP